MLAFRVGEARRATGTGRKLCKNGGLGMDVEMMLYEGIVVPTSQMRAQMERPLSGRVDQCVAEVIWECGENG